VTNTPDCEPHIDDVVRAWNAAIQCEGIGGSRAETMQELIAIRNRKTTWFGKYENDMRFAIDNYIRAKNG
jgi:hypothetical protein